MEISTIFIYTSIIFIHTYTYTVSALPGRRRKMRLIKTNVNVVENIALEPGLTSVQKKDNSQLKSYI